ncbi:MAG: NAD-binding protein, partial [Casimicrobiaceae bacterium]
PAYSRAVDAKGAQMIEGTFAPPQSRVHQHRKDLRLIIEAAARSGRVLPFATTHAAVLDVAIAEGAGDLDNAAIIDTLRQWRPAAGGDK